jgi:hypothetical protein
MRTWSAILLAGCALAAAQLGPEPWKDSQIIQPAALAARLADAHAARPRIYYVGFGVLYRSKHIPGAVYIGPASKDEGLELLKQTVEKLPRSEEIVFYCGCCPLEHCPNVRPAFRLLSEMGFTRARLLLTPTNFQKDWIDKGYPVETGSAK